MQIEAGKSDSGRRLDLWLEDYLPQLSRSRIQSLIKAGHVAVDGHRAKPHSKVRAGMNVRVEIPPPEPSGLAAEAIPLDILHEDSDVIVVNKPAGLVVHPAAGHAGGTLVNALLHHCPALPGIGGERRPGIVHRLDKNTSGAMVVAKNDVAMRSLVDQFKSGRVYKQYLALLHGTPRPAAGTIESLIGRSRHDRKKMTARPHAGRKAVTHYRVLETMPAACLVRAVIATGRTHQIRVHMAHIGHHVIGDTQYGQRRAEPKAPRQMLHAHILRFSHPRSNQPLEYIAPVPADMQTMIEQLRDGTLDKTARVTKN
jgi:23S rRNA pseudouridine1911/1915/1917 synthase